MKQRIKLADRQLPNYSKGEEIEFFLNIQREKKFLIWFPISLVRL